MVNVYIGDLSCAIYEYAKQHDLIFSQYMDKERREWSFTLRDANQTWGYRRIFSFEQINFWAGNDMYYIDRVIEDAANILRRHDIS